MNASPIKTMIERYDCKNANDYKNALKEIVQEVTLCGLSRSGFFEKAAFYGGTALRIFYGLDRFSEDMDFSLTAPDANFEIKNHFSVLKEELASLGFSLTIEKKEKSKDSVVQSAFIKGNTLEHLIKITPLEPPIQGIQPNENIKIKFEIDTNPPDGAECETKYQLIPVPFTVQLYKPSSLFAGKIHAVLCRNWKTRIKGRDFYDYIWYLSKEIPVNLYHLQKRMEQTNNWNANNALTLDKLKELLFNRFYSIDYAQAKKDVEPFISDIHTLDLWSADFFSAITANLKAESPHPDSLHRGCRLCQEIDVRQGANPPCE